MKQFFVLMCALVIAFGFVLAKIDKVKAASFSPSRQIAQCDTQDPNSPCFAPGEKADDTPAPSYSTPTPTPISTATHTPTPVPQNSYPSKEDILNMTDGDSGGVGLLGAFMFSPIVSMIASVIGFFIFVGIVILVIVVLLRRANKKNNKS